jgi:autotransporter-associated beta strand protein
MIATKTIEDSNRSFVLDSSTNRRAKRFHDAPLSNRAFAVFFVVTILIAIGLLLAPKARANNDGDGTWLSAPDTGDWEPIGKNTTNWSNGKNKNPGDNSGTTTNPDTATFNNASSITSIVINVAPLNIKNITFDTSAASYTIGTTAGNSLLLSSGGTIQIASTFSGTSKTETINAPIVLEPLTSGTAGSYTFANNVATTSDVLNFGGAITGGTTSSSVTLNLAGTNTGTNTISGAIGNGGATGGVAVTKSGTGTWILSGTTDNTYTGTTTVNGGILELAKTSTASVDAVSGDITIGDGATTAGLDILRLAGSGGNQIANTSILTFNGTGSNAGTFRMNAQSETIGGISSIGGAGVIENGTSGTSTLTVSNSSSQSFSGIIRNGAAGTLALAKSGGGTQTLTGNNTYTGTTTVNASGGTLEAAAAGALGSGTTGTSSVTVNSGGTLLVSNAASNDHINNNAGITLSGGTFRMNATSEGTTVAAGAGVGALTLTSSSVIDLAGTNPSLHFAASNGQSWSGTLSIWNWNGTLTTGNGVEQIAFGSNASGLTAAQLSQISFYSDAGTSFLGTAKFAPDFDGEIIPVPEPSTWIGAALALGAVGFTQRRRLRALALRRV